MTPESLEKIGIYLSGLRDKLARDRIPANKVVFEFFVKRKSLARAYHQWRIPLTMTRMSAARSRLGSKTRSLFGFRDGFHRHFRINLRARLDELNKASSLIVVLGSQCRLVLTSPTMDAGGGP